MVFAFVGVEDHVDTQVKYRRKKNNACNRVLIFYDDTQLVLEKRTPCLLASYNDVSHQNRACQLSLTTSKHSKIVPTAQTEGTVGTQTGCKLDNKLMLFRHPTPVGTLCTRPFR
jgi:hypothetical protein